MDVLTCIKVMADAPRRAGELHISHHVLNAASADACDVALVEVCGMPERGSKGLNSAWRVRVFLVYM